MPTRSEPRNRRCPEYAHLPPPPQIRIIRMIVPAGSFSKRRKSGSRSITTVWLCSRTQARFSVAENCIGATGLIDDFKSVNDLVSIECHAQPFRFVRPPTALPLRDVVGLQHENVVAVNLGVFKFAMFPFLTVKRVVMNFPPLRVSRHAMRHAKPRIQVVARGLAGDNLSDIQRSEG